MDGGVWVEKYEDTHVLSQAAVVGNGERGGNAEVLECGVAGEKVGDFHSQQIQSNNVATVN